MEYIKPEIEIIKFNMVNVVTTSCTQNDVNDYQEINQNYCWTEQPQQNP